MSDTNPHAFRNALGQFATGVTVVTTMDENGKPVGVTASSFNSVSLDPPLVLWSLAKSSKSMPAYQNSGGFNVHVLASHQDTLSNQFARPSEDKFSGVGWVVRRDEQGLRGKERVFSPRSLDGSGDFKDQPAEFWDQYKTEVPDDCHVRIHPILHWTELDIWRYTKQENII